MEEPKGVGTRAYGASDDLIEFEGDLRGEVGYYTEAEDESMGALIAFSDGTILAVRYGKPGLGVWAIVVLREGDMFLSHVACNDEDADPHSDVVRFKPGKLKAWAGTGTQMVR